MTGAPPLPDRLRRAVAAGFEPVRPLPPASRRVLWAAAWVPVAALVSAVVLGLRGDGAALGEPLQWGVSLVEAALGLVLVARALSTAIAGRGASVEGSAAALVLSALAFGTQASLSHASSPDPALPNAWLSTGPVCFVLMALLGLPLLAILFALLRRAAPLRVAFAGLLGGAGAGLIAEGAYRLHCGVTDLRHVLVWHGGAILVLVLAAWGAGLWWERRSGARLAVRPEG